MNNCVPAFWWVHNSFLIKCGWFRLEQFGIILLKINQNLQFVHSKSFASHRESQYSKMRCEIDHSSSRIFCSVCPCMICLLRHLCSSIVFRKPKRYVKTEFDKPFCICTIAYWMYFFSCRLSLVKCAPHETTSTEFLTV